MILQSIIASGAFHEAYNTGWSYNYFNTKWHPYYGPQYTAALNDDSSSSSSGTRSSEDSSDCASISHPSSRNKKANNKKKYHNHCKCSCKDCYKLMQCCISKCKRCSIKSTATTKKPITPTWPPYNTGPAYMFWPYVLPIVYSMKTSATTTTGPKTTTSKYTTTPTTTTTSSYNSTSTCPTTTTTGSTTTTTSPTTTTTYATTATTRPTTTTTRPTTTTTRSTTTATSTTTRSTSPPTSKLRFSLRSTYVGREYSDEDTTPLFLKEDDSSAISSHEIPDKPIPDPHKDYVYYDDTTTFTERNLDYNYYKDYITTTRTNKNCDTPKCLRSKKKIYYYIVKQIASTNPPFFMPTKSVSTRKRFSVFDNAVYREETLKDYYNMVNDENMNNAGEYYYTDYYYYADNGNYNNLRIPKYPNFKKSLKNRNRNRNNNMN